MKHPSSISVKWRQPATASVAEWCVDSVSVVSVTQYVCLRYKKKTAWPINTKLGRHTVHDSPLASTDPQVKRSKVTQLLNVLPASVCTSHRYSSLLRFYHITNLVIGQIDWLLMAIFPPSVWLGDGPNPELDGNWPMLDECMPLPAALMKMTWPCLVG